MRQSTGTDDIVLMSTLFWEPHRDNAYANTAYTRHPSQNTSTQRDEPSSTALDGAGRRMATNELIGGMI
jgi:hypothetical protein